MVRSILFFCCSLFLVAFGQAAWSTAFSFAAASIGYALFWCCIASMPHPKKRFLWGFIWFSTVQLIQLSWLISHPYSYIYIVHLLLALAMGTQFGFISVFVTRSNVVNLIKVCAIAGGWALLEWSRLFLLSGLTWNPSGLALAASTYGLQSAALWGVYGMSFWVILVNLLFLRAWFSVSKKSWVLASVALLAPYLFGVGHFHFHEPLMKADSRPNTRVLLVQTNFPAEEGMGFASMQDTLAYIQTEWQQILSIVRRYRDQEIDLIALPEAVVPYGAYYPLFRHDAVAASFDAIGGDEALLAMAPLEKHLAMEVPTPQGNVVMVNHAFWAQSLANLLKAPLVVGMEDAEINPQSENRYFLSAFMFYPHSNFIGRYDKRVLLPMAEYIPSKLFQKLAAKYGVTGSFTCGTEAQIFHTPKLPIGLSICYEETFGDLMRENRQKGAEMLVNITSDVWYPHSRLPIQHMEHARVRTVEMGIPLVRSCNTGVTGAIDSLGCTISFLENDSGDVEDISDALLVDVPRYTYATLYSKTGDLPVLLVSTFFVLLGVIVGLRGSNP